MSAQSEVRELVERYQRSPDAHAHPNRFVEELLRKLSWSTRINKRGDSGFLAAEHLPNEGRVPPKFSLVLGDERKCFVGVQPASIELDHDTHGAISLRRFAWSADIAASVVTNFEQLVIYSGRIRPRSEDGVDAGRIGRFRHTEYEQRWDEMSDLLSPQAVERGSLDRAANLTGAQPFDDAFLDDLEHWRHRFARSVDFTTPGLPLDVLNLVVQSLIDRIVFLRICEDRGIEPHGTLKGLLQANHIYDALLEQFRRANGKYNAGLFRADTIFSGVTDAGGAAAKVAVEDNVIREMIEALYYPNSPYEFSVVSADLLGQVYERFLGKVIHRSTTGEVVLDLKPEARKAGGVYYTPARIVRSIVKNTVGELCRNKSPDEIASLRILDPSCGSGSFLNATYNYLLEWHKRYYFTHRAAGQHGGRLRRTATGAYALTFEERKRILLNNVYGVDIDAQAIEITKLSLLLKVLEAESDRPQRKQATLVRDLPLPDLSKNIVCGDSLVAMDFVPHLKKLPDDERAKFVPFDYGTSFSQVFQSDAPGFDAVIGNPPYLSYSGKQSVKPPDPVRNYFKARYLDVGWPSAHAYFIKRSVSYWSRRFVSFIVPDQVGHLDRYAPLRKAMLDGFGLVEVRYLGENVFKGVITPALTFVLEKGFRDSTKFIEKDGSARAACFTADAAWHVSPFQSMLDQLRQNSFSIEPWLRDSGIRTDDKATQVVRMSERRNTDVPVLEGRCIQRYRCEPPEKALRMPVGESGDFEKATFLIRQTASYPIVGPHEHAVYFRNTLLALHAPDGWPHVHYLVALLNSRLLKFIYSQIIREAGQTTLPQVKKKALTRLPFRTLRQEIPEEKAFHDCIVRDVKELLDLHRSSTPDDRSSLQHRIDFVDDRIDRLVFELYGLSDEQKDIVNRHVPHVQRVHTDASVDVGDMHSDALWLHVNQGPTDAHWNDSLDELVAREDPAVAAYVAAMLPKIVQSNRLDLVLALVFAAERAQSFDAQVRASLTNGLLNAAWMLRDHEENSGLMSAIRRFASLVPITKVDGLLDFLRDEDRLTTKQVTLQCIQNIFSVAAPVDCDAVLRLRARVHALAQHLIDPSRAVGPATESLALQAYCAAAALRDPNLSTLKNCLASLEWPYLIERAEQYVASLNDCEKEHKS